MFSRADFIWLGTVFIALFSLVAYGAQAGRPAEAPLAWPGELEQGPDFTVALFAHPKCPCTRATLRQVKKALTKTNPRVKVYVIFMKPPNTEPSFHLSELWEYSQQLPVTTLSDESGRLSALFGTYTSGQVLLYDSQGKLSFSGGITSSRGHEGGSIGMEALERALAYEIYTDSAPVYGCPLLSDEDTLCRP